MANRHQVDLSIKKPIYDDAMARMRDLQRDERTRNGVRRSSLADVGRNAIMNYRRGDGADYAPRIVRSPSGEKPQREPFRFEMPADLYERQKSRITLAGHRVTQVVEEALKRFTETGEIPSVDDEN